MSTCAFPGCQKAVYPGSLYCSRTHRDTAPQINAGIQYAAANMGGYHTSGGHQGYGTRGGEGPQLATCAVIGCGQPIVPGGFYCVKGHHGPTAQPQQQQQQGSTHRGHRSGSREIKFYDKNAPYYEFTNFSDHPIRFGGKDYPTSEHVFQSLKFEDPNDVEAIRRTRSPREALSMARSMSSRVRPGWTSNKLNIAAMDKALLLKFTQYDDLRDLLLSTGNATLIEDSPIDPFWGVGSNGLGENQLGKALMRLRDKLRG